MLCELVNIYSIDYRTVLRNRYQWALYIEDGILPIDNPTIKQKKRIRFTQTYKIHGIQWNPMESNGIQVESNGIQVESNLERFVFHDFLKESI